MKTVNRVFAALAVSLSIASAPFAADKNTEARIKRIENGLVPALVTADTKAIRLQERMAHFRVPGISIAVIEGGKIAWARGYGVRDLNGKELVDAQTVFQAASISKPVSAVAALKLVELGKLNLDEDVNNKLTSWKVPENEFTGQEKVTLRRILTHRAGLSTPGFPGYPVGEPVPTTLQVLDGLKPANTPAVRVDALPQSQTRYSGGGFTVMQQLIEDADGKPFAQALQELVLKPIGMTRSAFTQPLAGLLATNAVSGHSDGKVIPGKFRVHPELAAAGMWTTPTDLARFAIELQQAAAGKSTRLLSRAMAQEMLKSQGDEWGLSVVLEGKAAQQRFMHRGANYGFNCLMMGFKESGAGIVVMANSDSGNALIEEVVRAVANEYGWKAYATPRRTLIDVAAESLPPYTGFYQSAQGMKMRVRLDGGQLIAQGSGTWSTLLAGSGTRFYSADDGAQIDFVKNAKGEVESVIVQEEGAASAPLTRTKEPAVAFDATPFYLRGSMNEWSTGNRMTAAGKDVYSASLALKPGSHEFKLGSEDFSVIDFGGSPSQPGIAVDAAKTLLPVGLNLVLSIAREGTYLFTLDVKDPLAPVLTVTAK
jgi:CubicO group peptidase (beta-lactamase class C family)